MCKPTMNRIGMARPQSCAMQPASPLFFSVHLCRFCSCHQGSQSYSNPRTSFMLALAFKFFSIHVHGYYFVGKQTSLLDSTGFRDHQSGNTARSQALPSPAPSPLPQPEQKGEFPLSLEQARDFLGHGRPSHAAIDLRRNGEVT